MQVISEYVAAAGDNNSEAMGVLRGMVLSTINEIDKAEVTDVPQAKRLAGNVVQLLNPIIKEAGRNTDPAKKDEVFEYRLIQADMMVRAGQYKESQDLALALQQEKEADIRPYMTEARAIFFQAQSAKDPKSFAKAQDYFTRILARMTPGAEGFWESWLRILQSIEAQNAAAAPEIKARLGDLKAVYGAQFGGTHFKDDFARLAGRYGI